MPVGHIEDKIYKKVLVVGVEDCLLEALREFLPESDQFRFGRAFSAFGAGIQVGSFRPDCVIIDTAIGQIEAGRIAQGIRSCPDHAATVLVALLQEPRDDAFTRLNFDAAFAQPFEPKVLADRIRALIAQKKDHDDP